VEATMNENPTRVFITDCEGPITKNDNAAELADAFIPRGHEFFRKISLYDDYLAEVVHRPDYKAGDTLRLILPFYKAFGLDERSMERFSRRNIQIIPQADRVLRELNGAMPAYIVSTSYAQYISGVCEVIGFPFANTYSTLVNLDDYELPPSENKTVKALHQRILDLPEFVIPQGANSADDLTDEDRRTVFQYDEIFWETLPEMAIYRIIEDVNPVGGKEKAAAVLKILDHEEAELEDVVYVGDSITDIEAFRIVKAAGGLALSFNGNDWAVKEASFAVTALNALPIGWITKLFVEYGLKGFEDLTMGAVEPESIERVTKLSCRVRKTVRTEKIGGLG
jgi:energy-converting hydrogenase A subunit R